MAEQQIKTTGGVLGKPVSFKIVDDTSSANVAPEVADQLIEQGSVALLGPLTSSQAIAVQDHTRQKQLIEISASATSPTLTAIQPLRDRYFFRTVPPDDFQGKAAALVAFQGPEGSSGTCRKLAIVHNDDDYGNPLANVISNAFTHLGANSGTPVSIVADIKIPSDVKQDYLAEVNTLIAAAPDCQALVMYDPAGDQYLRDLKDTLRVKPSALSSSFFSVGTDGVYANSFIVNGRDNKADENSPTVAEGTYGINPDTNPPTAEYAAFKSMYTAQFPLPSGQEDLDPYTANQFDAAILVALAFEKAGTLTDRVKIRDALYDVSKGGKTFGPANLADAFAAIRNGEDIDYRGASGEVDFDDSGNVQGDYILWKVQGGKFITIRRVRSADLQQTQ